MTRPPFQDGTVRELAAVVGQAAFIALVVAGCFFDELPEPFFLAFVAVAVIVLIGSLVVLLVDLWRHR